MLSFASLFSIIRRVCILNKNVVNKLPYVITNSCLVMCSPFQAHLKWTALSVFLLLIMGSHYSVKIGLNRLAISTLINAKISPHKQLTFIPLDGENKSQSYCCLGLDILDKNVIYSFFDHQLRSPATSTIDLVYKRKTSSFFVWVFTLKMLLNDKN